MLIIVEGADATGKTRLVETFVHLIRRTCPDDQVTLMHKGAPTDGWLKEYCTPITENYHPTQRHHMILDRWHWGERVWPEIFGRESLFDDSVAGINGWQFTEDLIARNGGIVVWCRSTFHKQQEVMSRRGEEVPSISQLRKIDRLYRDCAFQHSRLPSYGYDYETTVPDKLLDHAKAHQYLAARKCYA